MPRHRARAHTLGHNSMVSGVRDASGLPAPTGRPSDQPPGLQGVDTVSPTQNLLPWGIWGRLVKTSWGWSPTLSGSPARHPSFPQGDRSPPGPCSELLGGPPPPPVSQSHQGSRFTCRAGPSAQEPRAGRPACPERAPGPAPFRERAGAPKASFLNRTAWARGCCTLTCVVCRAAHQVLCLSCPRSYQEHQ